MTPIPFIEFQLRIAQVFPDARGQDIAPAPHVHIFDETWFQETFWPYLGAVKREINAKVSVRPLQNNVRRGICDEINKRMLAELTLCTRTAHDDADVAPGAVEATVLIGTEPLNLVPTGWHRCAIVGLPKDHVSWRPVFVESQLDYANYQTTDLLDAAGRGVVLRESFL